MADAATWRLLADRDVSHSSGLAVDEALVSGDLAKPTLRLYTYRQCVLVGRFQHVPDVVHVERCRRDRMPVNRRPTGGGAIIMGPEQLGIALAVPCGRFPGLETAERFMRRCADGIVNALSGMDVDARFSGKNDLVVGGRKIAGLGAYASASQARLFHASILVDIDIEFMLSVLKTPFQKMAGKGCASVADRITTLRREAGNAIDVDSLAGAIKDGYEREFCATLVPGVLDDSEHEMAKRLQIEKYDTSEWVDQRSVGARDRDGRCMLSTPAGMLDVRAIVAGEFIKSVFINGDFVASDGALLDLENSLRWHQRESGALAETVRQSMRRHKQVWSGMTPEFMTEAIVAAVDKCARPSVDVSHGACFAKA